MHLMLKTSNVNGKELTSFCGRGLLVICVVGNSIVKSKQPVSRQQQQQEELDEEAELAKLQAEMAM